MRRIIHFIIPVLFAASLVACKKENTAPPPAVENLTAFPGRYRVMVEFPVPDGAVKGKVFYNNGSYKEFDITGSPQSVEITDLTEQEHILRVVTINADGKVSDPRAVKVNIYGDKYEEALRPRRLTDTTLRSSTSADLLFEPALSGETSVRVVFTNTSGKKDSVDMPGTQNSVTLNNINLDEPYYFYSVYKPDAASMDYFYSKDVDVKEVIKLNFKKQQWVIAGFSGETTIHTAAMAIDNSTGTFWQSVETPSAPGDQHWITIDMRADKVIDGFYVLNPYTNNKSATTIRIEISDDNATWTLAQEAALKVSFLRQKISLSAPVTARYVRITAVSLEDDHTPGMSFAEIDAYNSAGTSADNGNDAYSNTTAVALVNAKKPFQGDGSNPFPPLGDYRFQKLLGWTHSPNAVATYDNSNNSFSLFTAAVWGLPEVVNGKVYQTVNLQPGTYLLKIDVAGADGPVDIYAIVAGGTLPDYTNAESSASVMRYADLIPNQGKTIEIPFAVTTAGAVNIGVVYNIRSQYESKGVPWSSFNINGFQLSRVVL